MLDMHRKCRGALQHGEKHPRSKLTDAQTNEIRVRYASGARGYKLASEFGVSTSLVSLIVRGERRPDVDRHTIHELLEAGYVDAGCEGYENTFLARVPAP